MTNYCSFNRLVFAKGEGMGRRLDWEFGISRCKQLYMGFPGGSDDKESACNEGDPGLTLGLGRSPREGSGNPLQYSCLGNPMDRGAWWATIHGVAKS